MPSIPNNTQCSHLGCKANKSKYNQYCIQHGGKDEYRYNDTKKRKDFNAKYNTRQWLSLRQIQLSRHPLCEGCKAEGIITPATVVDHIFPWSQIGEQAFYMNKFQSLCVPHHSEKTQLEQKGILRAYGIKDYTIGDYPKVVQ
jgi:5-methylcytosine-specific restriction protein A